MKLRTEEEILSSKQPSDIFTMDANTIEQEYEQYIENFKPKAYNTIRNFVVTQRVTLMYRKALSILNTKSSNAVSDYVLSITDEYGNVELYDYHYIYDIKLGTMYVTEENIIFLVYGKHKKYFDNYINKTNNIPKLNKSVFSRVEYSFPKLSKWYKTDDGNFAIILDKPCKIFPLREILNYFGGKLKHEHVAAIINRLYYFVCYMDVIGMQHNGITIDNLFFAPGKTVKEGEPFTVDDMRIIGVFGGWFFTTNSDEQIMGMPKEVYESLPTRLKNQKYSSFEVDELSIKRVARELLGDVTGENLDEVPEPFKKWVTNTAIHHNAYEEYTAWEEVVIQSYGKRRFVDMDISI